MNIFVLFGQTATGKTAKALELVDRHEGEIINFDSRQIYKKLDIITGKDRPSDPKYKIWLYDIIDPKESFSSAEFVKQAEEVITDIISRGKTPILVGGTGYYLKHLIYGIPENPVKEDWDLRKQLETKSVEELQSILGKKNKTMLDEMNNSDRNNPRRLIRRIEIADSGESLAEVSQTETLSARLGNRGGCQNGLTISYLPFFHASQDSAREKITQRVEQRMKDGALAEVEYLLKEGYTKDDPGLNAMGYKQLIAYHNNELTLSEAKKQWVTREVQYAKRQKTYFKKYFVTRNEDICL
jgi:tRNA dimethylallyltransferase